MTQSKIPQQKDENKEPFYTWTKKWGWRVNGYINTDNYENSNNRK